MTEKEINKFKELNRNKEKIVALVHSAEIEIVNIRNEIYLLQKNCNHQYADGGKATNFFHPFTSCKICGKVIL